MGSVPDEAEDRAIAASEGIHADMSRVPGFEARSSMLVGTIVGKSRPYDDCEC